MRAVAIVEPYFRARTHVRTNAMSMPREDGALRRVLGWPSAGALERLPIICAHCDAVFTPSDLDYGCLRERFKSETLRDAFVPLERDDETNAFLISSRKKSTWTHERRARRCTELRRTMSLTEANAVIGRGKMFVFSESHVETLLAGTGCGREWALDVGAGCGDVTSRLAAKVDKVCATESSPGMVARLREKEFKAVLESDTVEGVVERVRAMGHQDLPSDGFDVVSALNLVDRVDSPTALLRDLRAAVNKTTGVVILAIVVPFRPFVERADGTRGKPSEFVDAPSTGSWETGVESLWANLIKPSGFDLLKLSRVPYISEGDHKFGAYVLDDAVFVLRPTRAASDVPKVNDASETVV